MKKCKCINESILYLIDDSFDEDSEVDWGLFKYNVKETAYGTCYHVKCGNKENGFDKIK